MGYWKTRGLRGNTFEELINITNETYRKKKLALIQKVPTPITPVRFDSKEKKITLAYFDKPSTVDYIGAVQGLPVCFDAKETTLKSLPLQNIHAHQMEFMDGFEAQGGIAFLIVSFRFADEFYYLPYNKLARFYSEARKGGRKSIPYEEFDKRLKIRYINSIVHYLDALCTYLETMGGEGKV